MIRRLATAAVLLAFLLAGTGAPSWAGGAVVSSAPADGAALARPPDEVDLAFSAAVDVDASHAGVSTVAGKAVDTGVLRREGRDALRLPVSITAAGDYLAAYHVVFADGTSVAGVVRFSVGTGVPPRPLAGAAAAAASAAGHQHGIDPLSAVLLVVDGLVLLAVVVLLVRPRPSPGRRDE